ncbi:hypothetical protein ACFV2X_50330 [Streptomyces sp. NPDC059679]|uniref:AMP-binding enzyme n=1 Tax=Streptomyces sp. NPDC059679 TaxID=3346903 RepID=UPI0036ADCDF9
MVVVDTAPGRGIQLVAAIVPRTCGDTDPRTLRAYLAELVPSYAIPARWVVVDEIPLTRNGRVDTPALLDCPCRKRHPCRSSRVPVLVEDAAEAIVSTYVEAG